VIEALATALLLAGTIALAVLGLLFRLRLSAAERALDRADVVELEAQRLWLAERQINDAQRLSEAAVSGSTLTVRAIHKGIAAIPFGVLEAIPATRDTTRIVRASHDLISDAVYGTIDAVNRGVGAGLRAGLKAGAKKPDATDAPAPREAK
jgi:threonine/homoserine efflux transporter RhtA